MVKTVNTPVWNESPRWELLRPISFSLEPSIPSSTTPDLDTARFISSVQILTVPGRTSIPDSDLMLQYALIAELETTRDGFVIRSNDLDEEAFGLTYREAYLDLLTSLRDRYYSLCKREESLSPHELTILNRLRNVLVPGQGQPSSNPSRTMALTVRDVEHGFVRKLGAEKDKSGDHIYFYLNHEGCQYTVGKLSHSWKGDLNDTQVLMLARKLYLRKREFEQFVDCDLEAAQVIDLWQRRRNLN